MRVELGEIEKASPPRNPSADEELTLSAEVMNIGNQLWLLAPSVNNMDQRHVEILWRAAHALEKYLPRKVNLEG